MVAGHLVVVLYVVMYFTTVCGMVVVMARNLFDQYYTLKNLHNFCKADIISPVIIVICKGVHMYNSVCHYSMSISYVSVKFNPQPTSIKTEAKFENS